MEKFMGKKLRSQLNGGRQGQGGFGPFMSLLMDERVGTATSRQQNNVGRVIKRGKSIAMTEALARAETMAGFTRESAPFHSTCLLSYKNQVVRISLLNFFVK
ncbi:small nuclear ribonucleoprotein G-like [Leopardus geoffroyi]|nr:small nuclear ribonucleoprotein G-like [Leopardus geoffroyi]